MLNVSIEQFGELPFQPVTAERATFLLRELNWGEHFVGTSMNPAMGNSDMHCYGLEDVLKFLTQGSSRLGNLKGSSRTGMSWIEPNVFLAWLRDVVQDSELADVIEQTLAEAAEKAQASEASRAARADNAESAESAEDTAEGVKEDAATRGFDLFEALGVTGMAQGVPYLEQVSIISECVGMRVVQLQEAIKSAEAENASQAEEGAMPDTPSEQSSQKLASDNA
jgi:hypothetical protein